MIHARNSTITSISTHRILAVSAIALISFIAACAAMLTAAPTSDAAAYHRRSVNAPSIRRFIIPVRAVFHGSQIATWYGPGFWGNRTGCGSTLRTTSWGIAHRTLPCGTMVQLTLGKRKVAVPVIDRGPYSGATIDLTRRTADALRFRQSSRNRVRMTVIKRYHFVPLRKKH